MMKIDKILKKYESEKVKTLYDVQIQCAGLGGGGDPCTWEQALKCDIIIYVTKNQVDTYYDQK